MNAARRRLIALPWGLVFAAGPARAADALQWAPLKQTIRERFPDVHHLSVPTLHTWLQDGARPAPLLVDTRTAAEYADGHLPGALHAESVAQLRRLLATQPRERPVVLYCSVGYRSSALATALRRQGVEAGTPVYNLEGSIFEWANAGHPVVKADRPTTQVHPYDRRWGTLLRRELWSREP